METAQNPLGLRWEEVTNTLFSLPVSCSWKLRGSLQNDKHTLFSLIVRFLPLNLKNCFFHPHPSPHSRSRSGSLNTRTWNRSVHISLTQERKLLAQKTTTFSQCSLLPFYAQEIWILRTGTTFSAVTENRTAALLDGTISMSNSLLRDCWKGDIFPLRIV